AKRPRQESLSTNSMGERIHLSPPSFRKRSTASHFSCPSRKMSAVTSMVSPGTAFMGTRPPSTTGPRFSTTACKAWTSGTLEPARIAALAAADNGAGLAAEAASWNGRPVAGSTAVALDEITLEGADLAEGVLVETVLEEVALEEGAMEAGGLGAGLASCFAGFGACLEACLGAAFADVAAVDFGLAPAGDLGVIGFGADLFLRDCLGAAMILDQLLVKVMGAPGHLGPGEMLFYAFAGVSGHRHAEFGIVKEGVGGHGQAAR